MQNETEKPIIHDTKKASYYWEKKQAKKSGQITHICVLQGCKYFPIKLRVCARYSPENKDWFFWTCGETDTAYPLNVGELPNAEIVAKERLLDMIFGFCADAANAINTSAL